MKNGLLKLTIVSRSSAIKNRRRNNTYILHKHAVLVAIQFLHDTKSLRCTATEHFISRERRPAGGSATSRACGHSNEDRRLNGSGEVLFRTFGNTIADDGFSLVASFCACELCSLFSLVPLLSAAIIR